jgi:hypothetical protein
MKNMKIQTLFGVAIAALSMTSCVKATFYQLYQITPTSVMTSNDDAIVFEDANCKVSYNLWSEGGNASFQLYNKTDSNIYLNMEESFFIINGMAYDYYGDRVVTNSKSTGTRVSQSSSSINIQTKTKSNNSSETNTTVQYGGIENISTSGRAVSYNERKIIIVPAKASKNIAGFTMANNLYRDCDLLRFPNKRQYRTFSTYDAPFVFRNRISYTLGQQQKPTGFENEFAVTEIANLPSSEMMVYRYDEFCRQRSDYTKKVFKETPANAFYIKYHKDLDKRQY